MKKRFVVILDGLGDVYYPELGNKSPLEAAITPNLDFLAANGRTGMMYPIAKGVAPESDEAMISLLGFDPFKVHTGRGPLEAHGAGVSFRKGDVVFRCNFATVRNGKIVDIRAGRPSPLKARLLAKRLDRLAKRVISPSARFVYTVGYRCVLIVPGGLSPRVEGNHPGYKIVKGSVTSARQVYGKVLKAHPILPLERSAERTAGLVNAFISAAEHVLRNEKKANTILLRGAGNCLPALKRLPGKWLLISEMPVEKGIGRIVGMDIAKPRKDLARQVARNFHKYDSFYFQLKAPDKYGHDGNIAGKVRAISDIDQKFFGSLLKMIDVRDVMMIVTGDHSTPCKFMSHSSHPVPLLLFGNGVDSSLAFSEKACRKGSLGTFFGKDMLNLLKEGQRF